MLLADATKLIFQRWLDVWPTIVVPPVPYAFDNEALEESVPTYARVSVRALADAQQTLGAPGNRRYERRCIISVKLNVAPDAGRKLADQLVGHVRTVYEGVRMAQVATDDGVNTFASALNEVGSDGQYWTVIVNTQAVYWETR